MNQQGFFLGGIPKLRERTERASQSQQNLCKLPGLPDNLLGPWAISGNSMWNWYVVMVDWSMVNNPWAQCDKMLVLFESKVEYQSHSSQLSILNSQMLMIRLCQKPKEFCTLLSAMANRRDGFLDVQTLAVQSCEPDIRVKQGGSSTPPTFGNRLCMYVMCMSARNSLWYSDAQFCCNA